MFLNGRPDFFADRNDPLLLAPRSGRCTSRDRCALFEDQQITPVIEIHVKHLAAYRGRALPQADQQVVARPQQFDDFAAGPSLSWSIADSADSMGPIGVKPALKAEATPILCFFAKHIAALAASSCQSVTLAK